MNVAPDHPAFIGHFPGRPVLPAVVVLTEVLATIEAQTGQSLQHWMIVTAKFLMERWVPAILPEGDLEREAWSWLLKSGEGHPPVHCYFASDDRFAPGQRQMAQAVAPERVRELPGGHDWDAWLALWTEFLCNSKSALR